MWTIWIFPDSKHMYYWYFGSQVSIFSYVKTTLIVLFKISPKKTNLYVHLLGIIGLIVCKKCPITLTRIGFVHLWSWEQGPLICVEFWIKKGLHIDLCFMNAPVKKLILLRSMINSKWNKPYYKLISCYKQFLQLLFLFFVKPQVTLIDW